MQAIQAATLWASQAMGWEEIGSLQSGKLADVIALAGNPLTDMHTMDEAILVVSEGKIVKSRL